MITSFYALFFDASGVLWIGTEDGLDKYDPYENQFVLNKDISKYIGNQAPRIRGFSKTYDGRLIVQTRNNGLFILDNDDFLPLYDNQKGHCQHLFRRWKNILLRSMEWECHGL